MFLQLTGVDSYPSTASGGLLGFLLSDIYSAYRKYLGRLCNYCRRSGASLECASCRKKYHLLCGVKNGTRMKMLGNFPSFCKNCSKNIFPESDNLKKLSCAICYCQAGFGNRLYWPECCKPDHMIHFKCLQVSRGLIQHHLVVVLYRVSATSRSIALYVLSNFG